MIQIINRRMTFIVFVSNFVISKLFFDRFRSNTRELWSYNAVVADSRLPSAPDMQSRCSILSPELALPTGSKALTTRSHAALHILGINCWSEHLNMFVDYLD